MKILHKWLAFANDMERLVQPGSPIANKLTELKQETIRQLGMIKLQKAMHEIPICTKPKIVAAIIPKPDGKGEDFIEGFIKRGYIKEENVFRLPQNVAELNDQIGMHNKDSNND